MWALLRFPGVPAVFEQLVGRTRETLQSVCDHLDLAFDTAMERYYERAPERLAEHEARFRADGSPLTSKAQRLENQRFTSRPPEPARIGRWRVELRADEIDAFEAAAGSMLRALGYT
jgi:hypothetical protein